MTMHPAGREYLTWHIVTDADPAPAIQVSIDGGTSWHDTEAISGGVRALVAGPLATGNPDGTIVLPVGITRFTARVVDNPEVVVRGGGDIRVGLF